MKSLKKTKVAKNQCVPVKIHTSKWKIRCKSVKKEKQNSTQKPKKKFNARYNLRRKAAHLSINTEKGGCVPAEFKSPERDGGDNRTNTELVNS